MAKTPRKRVRPSENSRRNRASKGSQPSDSDLFALLRSLSPSGRQKVKWGKDSKQRKRVNDLLKAHDEKANPPAASESTRLDWHPGHKVHGCKIVKLLGRGAAGDVYEAEARGGKKVALKRVFLDRLVGQAEVKGLDLLRPINGYPNLVSWSHEWKSTKEKELVIEMELGLGSLADLEQLPTLSVLLGYMRDAAKGLDYLHRQNLVHQDVKRANLIRFGGETVKLTDYSGVRSLQDANPTRICTHRAPESRLALTTDQYCLALTYLELRTGKNSQVPPHLSALLPDEKKIIRRALTPEPNDRWPSCTEFIQALEKSVRKALMSKSPPLPQSIKGKRVPVKLPPSIGRTLLLQEEHGRPAAERLAATGLPGSGGDVNARTAFSSTCGLNYIVDGSEFKSGPQPASDRPLEIAPCAGLIRAKPDDEVSVTSFRPGNREMLSFRTRNGRVTELWTSRQQSTWAPFNRGRLVDFAKSDWNIKSIRLNQPFVLSGEGSPTITFMEGGISSCWLVKRCLKDYMAHPTSIELYFIIITR